MGHLGYPMGIKWVSNGLYGTPVKCPRRARQRTYRILNHRENHNSP